MALLASSALCLLGILIYGSFLETEAANCDHGWERYKDNCFKVFENEVTWLEAEIQCKTYGCGTHLASIHSKEESLWVAKYIQKHKFNEVHFWMGLIDFRQDGKWSWTDGTAFKYKAWMKGQPDTYEEAEYCAHLARESDFSEWNDARCNQVSGYLCKRKRRSKL